MRKQGKGTSGVCLLADSSDPGWLHSPLPTKTVKLMLWTKGSNRLLYVQDRYEYFALISLKKETSSDITCSIPIDGRKWERPR